MGSIVIAKCGCGFERQMYLGGGMRNFETYCAFPVYCGKCRTFFEANLYQKEIACPACGEAKDVFAYDDGLIGKQRGARVVFRWATEHAIGRDLVLTDGAYLCPQCGQFALSFAMAGYWD